jgi:16S rRNA (cytidine1402-2'-O)-methyltransferase
MSCPEHWKSGLILVPTPIEESLPLDPLALDLLRDAAQSPSTLILVEELKVARIRWLQWGLPRESIERFIAFNEHTEASSIASITRTLAAGGRAVLMSDGGLPAFCDPGMKLVRACHEAGIRVTASPFPNSIILALALSGFEHRNFFFAGFPPAQAAERKRELEQLHARQKSTVILMDTPYRMKSLLQAICDSPFRNRRVFLATGLNSPGETLLVGKPSEVLSALGEMSKAEFVLIIEGG